MRQKRKGGVERGGRGVACSLGQAGGDNEKIKMMITTKSSPSAEACSRK